MMDIKYLKCVFNALFNNNTEVLHNADQSFWGIKSILLILYIDEKKYQNPLIVNVF